MCGAVFVEDAATVTVNVAGARLNVPSVVLDVSLTLIVVAPCATGVTVSVFISPQDANVSEDGLTVATAGLLDATERARVVEPVRLQPLLPSPFLSTRYKVVVPFAPPTVSGITSATASTDASSELEMSSAKAAPANTKTRPIKAAATTAVHRFLIVCPEHLLIIAPIPLALCGRCRLMRPFLVPKPLPLETDSTATRPTSSRRLRLAASACGTDPCPNGCANHSKHRISPLRASRTDRSSHPQVLRRFGYQKRTRLRAASPSAASPRTPSPTTRMQHPLRHWRRVMGRLAERGTRCCADSA